jgi:hypothetical protein
VAIGGGAAAYWGAAILVGVDERRALVGMLPGRRRR